MSGFFEESCGHVESKGCWCDPEVLQCCPECDAQPLADCCRCGGSGLVPEFCDELPTVTLHRDMRL